MKIIKAWSKFFRYIGKRMRSMLFVNMVSMGWALGFIACLGTIGILGLSALIKDIILIAFVFTLFGGTVFGLILGLTSSNIREGICEGILGALIFGLGLFVGNYIFIMIFTLLRIRGVI